MRPFRQFFRKRNENNSYWNNVQALVLLLLIPIFLIFIINLIILCSKNVSSVKKSLKLESEQKLELLHSNLSPMYQLVGQRRTDRAFSTEYLRQTHFTDAYFNITRTLQRDSVWISFFDSISYYNCEENIVFTYNSTKSPEEFFGKTAGTNTYPIPSIEVEDYEQQLSQGGNTLRVLRAHNIDGGDGVVFAVPLELDGVETPRSYMIFTVSDRTLSNLWGDKEGISYLLFYNQTPFYGSGNWQANRLTLSEITSDKLDYFYHWNLEGLTICWQLRLSYFLRSILPEILIEIFTTFFVLAGSVVLLLYYSRKTYEPVSQILKHVPQHTGKNNLTEEFQYINFMLEELTSTKKVLEQTNQELYREKYLYYLFGNLVKPDTPLAKQCADAGINIGRRWFACILLTDIEGNSQLYERFRDFEQKNDKSSNLYSTNVSRDRTLYLLASDLDKDVLESSLKGLSEKEGDKVYVSNVAEGIENIHSAYHSICGSTAKEIPMRGEYPVLELQFLKTAIEEENINKAEFSVRILKENLIHYSDAMRGAVLMTVGTIFCKGDMNRVNQYIYSMPEFDTKSVCKVFDCWLEEYSNETKADAKPGKRTLTRNMHTILRYIEDNAAKPEFTIKAMAAEFGTSASNLGHQFKKATGQTLSSFIDEWRLGKAEEMLEAGIPINEISQKLGYLSTPAFTEAFKRLRGMTPSAWRSKIREENGTIHGEKNKNDL